MIHYLLRNEDGSVFQRGQCATSVEIPNVPGTTPEVIHAHDERQPPAPPPPGYREHRAMAYPSIGDQLDVLWKSLNGDLADDAVVMLAKINAVKRQFPKE